MKNLDKYRGCLIGGAAGDALGYAVEFFDAKTIFRHYGERGITKYALTQGVAQISDDTQMTLFTANGLLCAKAHEGLEGYKTYIGTAYQDWYRTQNESFPLKDLTTSSWLLNVPELFSRRAPGGTCMQALAGERLGSVERPINSSKGCGGVMRVAPIGLCCDNEGQAYDKIDRLGAEVAALTHGHELGYIPAAALVHIIQLVAHNDIALLDAVLDMREAMERQFSAASGLKQFLALVDWAIKLSQTQEKDLDCIRRLGGGWVGEEALAIALYCALKYADDFDKALIAAVNHGGDIDSTGAICGNILGAYLGLKAIPEKYLEKLELKNVILEIADDLYAEGKDETWESKYIYGRYSPEKK